MASWQEKIAPGEEELFERLARTLVEGRSGEGRTLHRYAQVGLEGRFVVPANVPATHAHGLFAKPGAYECYVRFSSGAGKSQSDRTPDVRGIAVKVVGVPGEKVIAPLAAAQTQDFLAILSNTFAIPDAETFVGIVEAAPKGPLTILRYLIGRVGFFNALRLAGALGKAQDKGKVSLAERTFWVPLPVRWGEHAAKMRFRPLDVPATPATIPAGDRGLTEALRARVRAAPLTFAVEAQLFVDEQRTPIEDGAVEWLESASPFVEVARLEIAAQDPESARGKLLQSTCESMSFDPWHALVEHRPLGSIMRARNAAYRVSTSARKATSELEVVPPSALAG
ncbi:MAG: hypothetical protein U0269_23095 [Polyangiales bacterium]